jgi:predicted TIM-barrel fold metal-dependent hydrolase
MLRRETFLGGLVAAGAGIALAPQTGFAQTRKRIDVHYHYAPPVWLSAAKAVSPAGQQVWDAWSTQRAVSDLDQNGVQKALLSISSPGLFFGDAAVAGRLARACNEYAATMVADHPGRFGTFLALPLPDIEATLREVAYGLDTLKADGVGMFTSYGGKLLGDPIFAPLFEELDRRRALIFVHPTSPACCSNVVPGIADANIEYATDTTRAIVRMIFSGSSRRYPNIRMIWSHAGGTLPFLNFRFIREAQLERYKTLLPDGYLPEARRFYYDTAQAAQAAPMGALLKTVPLSHIVFGTDYPYLSIRENVEGLRATGIFSTADLAALDNNAASLLRSS